MLARFRAKVDSTAKFIGPVWIGAGRTVEAGRTVIGPAVIWDDPLLRPASESIEWQNIEPTTPAPPDSDLQSRSGGLFDRAAKRVFDLFFSSIAILLTLPLYPFIVLAIWLEDGRPFFFAHTRETVGGREFPCIKFRSMRKDAEKMKALLKGKNQARWSAIFHRKRSASYAHWRVPRKYNLDELPQFFNVLVGDMSVVGPRPSPRRENQYCPPWREARLSVRPGITGLWQVKRTRRTGSDFQEWIKYDIEYVERHSILVRHLHHLQHHRRNPGEDHSIVTIGIENFESPLFSARPQKIRAVTRRRSWNQGSSTPAKVRTRNIFSHQFFAWRVEKDLLTPFPSSLSRVPFLSWVHFRTRGTGVAMARRS